MTTPLRVAVLGAGGIGRYHIKEFQSQANVEIVAVAEVDGARLEAAAREFRIPNAFQDYRALLKETRPDVVAVGLPNSLHCQPTLDALAAGCHVLCETPPAISASEAVRMANAARRTGRILAYHFNYRYTPEGRFLGEFAASGGFGDIYFARTGWHRMMGVPNLGTWFTRKSMAGGGPLIDLAVHRLDLALWLMGYPEPLSVSGAAFDHHARRLAAETGREMSVEDLACGFVRLANGAALIVEASWVGFSEQPETMFTELWGTRGGAVYRNVGGEYKWEAKAFRDEAGQRIEVRPRRALGAPPSYHADFLRAVRGEAPPPCTPEQGIRLMQILDGLYRSAAEGREIVLSKGKKPTRPGRTSRPRKK